MTLPRSAALLAVAILAAAAPARAQDDAQRDHPADRAMRACIDRSGGVTADMLDCADSAYGAWDRELNAAYQSLMARLDPASRALLRDAQRRWLAFREAETAFQRGPWTGQGGSLERIMLTFRNVDTLRERALALRAYEQAGGDDPADALRSERR